MAVARALLGVTVFCLFAWLLSSHKKRVPWRTVSVGIAIQLLLAFLILRTGPGIWVFQRLTEFVLKLMSMTGAGTDLVFGPLSDPAKSNGFIFAFAATGLCTIIFFSALMAILYYVGIMQAIIWVLAKFMSIAMGVSGAESMQMAAQIFVGQTEAGLTVKQYIPRFTRSEIQSLMTGGFGTMAASMIAVYTGLMDGTGGLHVYGPHILAAEVLSAPGAFVMAKLIRPESEEPETGAHFPLTIDRGAHNALEAAANGTRDGLMLFLNVLAMLISFSAIVALINWPLASIGDALGLSGGLSLGRIFGWILSPVAWLIGVDGSADCQKVGGVIGMKISTNEFIAFLQLKDMTPQAMEAAKHATTQAATSGPSLIGGLGYLGQRASILATYAICDFANFVSIGIQIGGFTPMAPERKKDFAEIAFKAMIGGCLTSWMTAAIAGMFV